MAAAIVSATFLSPMVFSTATACPVARRDVAIALEDLGFPTTPVLLHGTDRANQLVGYLKKHPVDLLVVGSHGHGLVRDLLYGQTVDKVRHGLNVPMLIARPDRAGAAVADRGARDTPSGEDVVIAPLARPARIGVDGKKREP